jgi:hypothetical protein
VAGHFQPRVRVSLIAASAAVVCWICIPGTPTDRAAFLTVSRASANPPLFISGNGSHADPWKLRTFAAESKSDPRQAPVIVSLGDDPEGFFQSFPPSPIDLAVVLANFHRLGAHKAATAAVLAWDSPDPMGLAALDKAISRFDSLVMSAPLSRGAVPETMPPQFRKASIPLSEIQGNTTELPIVNRIPLPGIILGGENTVAAFQTLDSEPDNGRFPMLARWDDRAVFAFPLLVAMQRLNLPLQGISVKLGEFIKLGPDGPVVPIDRDGRLSHSPPRSHAFAEIPASSLIDGGDDLIPKSAPQPLILRDDRSAAEPNTRKFSAMLPALVASISSNAAMSPERAYPRLQSSWELVMLSLVVALLAVFCKLPAFPRNIAFLLIASACITIQCVAASAMTIWLPGIAALAAVCCAFLVSWMAPIASLQPAIMPEISTPPVKKTVRPKPAKQNKSTKKPQLPSPAPEPVKKEPVKKEPVKKEPVKKEPVKKELLKKELVKKQAPEKDIPKPKKSPSRKSSPRGKKRAQ